MLRQPTTLPEADGGEAGDSEEGESESDAEGGDSDPDTARPTRRFNVSSLATTAVEEEPLRIDTKNKLWALPTPSAKASSSWTRFGDATPAAEMDSYFGTPPSSVTATPPISPQRPMLQSRASRSMVDLSQPPTKIEIPKPPVNFEWAKPPPTPAGGMSGFFWSKKDGRQIGIVKRRRSADDLVPPHL
jgi:hypothetical protein